MQFKPFANRFANPSIAPSPRKPAAVTADDAR